MEDYRKEKAEFFQKLREKFLVISSNIVYPALKLRHSKQPGTALAKRSFSKVEIVEPKEILFAFGPLPLC